MTTYTYEPEFYKTANSGSLKSAKECVPIFLKLLSPKSVVDVGCGQGEWLSVFADCGISDYCGVDGDYVSDTQLLIPASHFVKHDLTKPLQLKKRFDLAISLEVAEHLPKTHAIHFVKSLTQLSSAVIFSAALPGQGGINHINEEWPWVWQKLFADSGYIRLDPFRSFFWKKSEISYYYKQNIYLFVDPTVYSDLINQIEIPGKYEEMTLIRTTILQDMVGVSLRRRVTEYFKRFFSK